MKSTLIPQCVSLSNCFTIFDFLNRILVNLDLKNRNFAYVHDYDANQHFEKIFYISHNRKSNTLCHNFMRYHNTRTKCACILIWLNSVFSFYYIGAVWLYVVSQWPEKGYLLVGRKYTIEQFYDQIHAHPLKMFSLDENNVDWHYCPTAQ